jgi:prepilin-type N-terminal cleavage/methylation domain-containing protein
MKIAGGNMKTQPEHRQGFTLVEIMIVVAIIGVLCAIATPSFLKSRARAKVNRMAADIRVFADAFDMYDMEMGGLPASGANSTVPAGMESYIDAKYFAPETPCGGLWRWMNTSAGVFSQYYALCVIHATYAGGPGTDLALLQLLDETIDDGDPANGRVRKYGNHYHYVVRFK